MLWLCGYLKEKNLKRAKVVANLPYYITTPIIMKLLEEHLNLDSITVMVQKEVAERLSAVPGKKDTGSITYTIWYYTEPEIILDVPKDSFIPAPKVDSAVLKLNVLKEPRVKLDNEELFFKVIKAGFMQKRKTLLNSLSNSNIGSKEDLEKIFERFYRDDKARNRETGGTGLGLSIASTIVKAHGGNIKASHNTPKGTIFTIKLPR